jgi:isopentenyl-diphosphate Delta-isomerase
MESGISSRKMEHIETLLSDSETERSKHYFERISLLHHALPEVDFAAIDTGCEFLGKRLKFPFLISSMTGGSGEELLAINRNLALAAERCGVAMGVGSQRVMFRDKSARGSFELRRYAPNAVLCANLGAVQLNYGFGVEECRQAVEVLEADALILHLNPLQEICQLEGDTNFAGLSDKIARVVAELDVPVIVKEVGAGISDADAERLLAAGVEYIDVAGTGGTSWARVESRRAQSKRAKATYAFDDWGVPTPTALELLAPWRERIHLIASGGLRSGIDIAKALVMGAELAGMARPLLEPAMESEEAVVAVIERLRDEFHRTMFLLGCGCVADMCGREDLISRRDI